MKLLLLTSALFVPTLLVAQTQTQAQMRQERAAQLVARIQDLQRRHTTTVQGSDNPANIPRGEMLRMFFADLSTQAPPDDAAFRQFAIDRFGATESDVGELKQALRSVVNVDARGSKLEEQSNGFCPHVLDGSLPDALSIATYLTKMDEQENKQAEVRYQAIIDKLSPGARANLLQSVDQLAARSANSTLDYVGMAYDDPNLFVTMMKGVCIAKFARSRGSSLDAPAEAQR